MVSLDIMSTLFPSIVIGGIIGFLELIFVHADEGGLGLTVWFVHFLHTIPIMFIAVFINLNAEYFLSLVNLPFNLPLIAIYVVIGLLAMIKVISAAAIVKGSRVGEKFWHSLIIGILVALSPYIWQTLQPMFSSVAP